MALQATIKETTFHIGDTVEVHQKIKEKDKTRTQIFRGVVISIRGHGENKSFTVRRIAAGAIGVERIWPLNSPWISKIKVSKRGRVRRAKLYYLRERIGKGALRVKKADKKKVLKVSKVPKVSRGKKEEVRGEEEKSGKTGGKSSGKTSSKE